MVKFRREFGRNRVFTLRNAKEKDDSEKRRVAENFRAPRLFGEGVTLQKLSSLIAQGSEVKATLLSETFDMAAYEKANGKSHIPLFALDKNGNLRAFTDEFQPEVKAGWTLLSLVTPADSSAEQSGSVVKETQQGGGNQSKDRKVEETGN